MGPTPRVALGLSDDQHRSRVADPTQSGGRVAPPYAHVRSCPHAEDGLTRMVVVAKPTGPPTRPRCTRRLSPRAVRRCHGSGRTALRRSRTNTAAGTASPDLLRPESMGRAPVAHSIRRPRYYRTWHQSDQPQWWCGDRWAVVGQQSPRSSFRAVSSLTGSPPLTAQATFSSLFCASGTGLCRARLANVTTRPASRVSADEHRVLLTITALAALVIYDLPPEVQGNRNSLTSYLHHYPRLRGWSFSTDAPTPLQWVNGTAGAACACSSVSTSRVETMRFGATLYSA